MAIKIIFGYNDPLFPEFEDRFYNNFTPDDWDYIIVGKTKKAVLNEAMKKMVCDFQIAKVDGDWMAVTYHS